MARHEREKFLVVKGNGNGNYAVMGATEIIRPEFEEYGWRLEDVCDLETVFKPIPAGVWIWEGAVVYSEDGCDLYGKVRAPEWKDFTDLGVRLPFQYDLSRM